MALEGAVHMPQADSDSNPPDPLCTLISSTLGLTTKSPLWLMITRWPALLYRMRNFGALATMSCVADVNHLSQSQAQSQRHHIATVANTADPFEHGKLYAGRPQ